MTIAKTLCAGCTVGVLLWAGVGTLDAHHSIVAFDTETLVRIEGTIVRFDPVSPHSFIYVDGATADRPVERWALEGPGSLQLDRRGIARDLFRTGDTIQACGLVLKADRRGPGGVEGRVMVAATLRMSNGEGRIWSDYGQAHRCVELDPETRYVR